MKIPNFDELLKIINDKATLKILFYLREFNPNVSITDLVNNLKLEEKDVTQRLEILEKSNMILCLNGLYQLTTDGKNMVNGFYHNLGESLPE